LQRACPVSARGLDRPGTFARWPPRYGAAFPEQHRSLNSDPSQTLLGKALNKSNMKMHAKQKPWCNPLIEAI